MHRPVIPYIAEPTICCSFDTLRTPAHRRQKTRSYVTRHERDLFIDVLIIYIFESTLLMRDVNSVTSNYISRLINTLVGRAVPLMFSKMDRARLIFRELSHRSNTLASRYPKIEEYTTRMENR